MLLVSGLLVIASLLLSGQQFSISMGKSILSTKTLLNVVSLILFEKLMV